MAIDTGWMRRAACRKVKNPDPIFFPRKRRGVQPDYSKAKKICGVCRVRVACLAYSIAHNIPEGCWGGLDPNERRKLPRDIRLRYKKQWWELHPYSRPSRKREGR